MKNGSPDLTSEPNSTQKIHLKPYIYFPIPNFDPCKALPSMNFREPKKKNL